MTKITGLTYHQAEEMRRVAAPPGRTLIVRATTMEAPDMTPAELIDLVEEHKAGILGAAPARDHHTGESRRGRANATSSVLRKLRGLV